jgi:hypothetical protein
MRHVYGNFQAICILLKDGNPGNPVQNRASATTPETPTASHVRRGGAL